MPPLRLLSELLLDLPSRQLHVQTYFTPCSSVTMVNFEQVNALWVNTSDIIDRESSIKILLRIEESIYT